jgi:Protein of unknown function (DUF5818)
MKRTHHPTDVLAPILATAMLAFTPNVLAQAGQESNPPAQRQPDQQQPSQQPPDQQQSKTFQGKIMKLGNGKYALVTGQTPQGQMSGHFLDDQDTAKKYEGKQVTVTGTLEVASNTIHVTKIEEAA